MIKAKDSLIQIISIFFSIIVICSSIFTVNAATMQEDEISPCYVTISGTVSYIKISGIKANCYASITSDYSTFLSIKMELQKKKSNGYETIETWSANKTGSFLELSKSKNINLLSDYRLKVTFKADKESSISYKYP